MRISLFLDGVGDFFSGIGSIILLIIAFFGFFYFMAFLSKVSNKRIKINGQKVADPDSFDGMNAGLAQRKEQLVATMKKVSKYAKHKIDDLSAIKFESLIKDKTISKIQKLEAIEKLFNNGVINSQEFNLLKKEIFES